MEAPLGRGRVVLFGFRPQYRAQSWATYPALLNAIYTSAATPDITAGASGVAARRPRQAAAKARSASRPPASETRTRA